MSAIITIAQQKGGAGKTTLAVQLATAMRQAGRSVAVVDIDPQASLTAWMRLREHEAGEAAEIRFSMVGGWRLGVELDRWKRECERIIVDSAPHAESDADRAIKAADLVLVPCQPSPLDIWASKSTLDIAIKDGKPAFLVLNRVPPRGRSVDEALQSIAARGYAALSARLGNRQAFLTSFGRGLGVVESEPKSAAAQEVEALLAEVETLLR
jgi:chromosome partitioning protein